MIVPVREGAGLGHPPKHFTTNANESINKVIKKALNYEERNWDKFCDDMLSLVNIQYQTLEKCVLRTSEYHFSSSFSHLELPCPNGTDCHLNREKSTWSKYCMFLCNVHTLQM